MSKKKLNVKGYIVILVLFILVCVFTFIGFLLSRKVSVDIVKNTHENAVNYHDSKKQNLSLLQKALDESEADSAIVYYVNQDSVLAEKNSKKVRSLASITKLVTATLVYESYDSTSSRASILPKIQYMLTTSSNDEAKTLAYSFAPTLERQVEKMNNLTEKYGLSFRDVTGLDIVLDDGISRKPSSAGSAYGVARFTADTYKTYPEFFDTTIYPKDNTNVITDKISFLLGGKTGFTDLSGGNLVVIVQKGISQIYVVVVLGGTEKGRFVDVRNITKTLLQLSL